MINLVKLYLCLRVRTKKTFLDGHVLKKDILNQMSRLETFNFNIRSFNRFSNETNLPSNEDIQKTFNDYRDKQIFSYIDYFQETQHSHCHIYSYPYQLKHFDDITNHFSGGFFPSVRQATLYDEHPFEHEFFCDLTNHFHH
jgi:hypothetical protein